MSQTTPNEKVNSAVRRGKRRGRPTVGQSDEQSVYELLISSAIYLFARKGYNGTTVRDIADRAGVNISLVSYYFGGKEGIYRTALSRFGEERLESARRVLVPPDSVEEVIVRLSVFLDELFLAYIKEPDLVRMLHLEVEKGHPIVKDLFRQTLFEVYQTLVNFFEDAKKRKILVAGFDPKAAAGIVFAVYSQAVRGERLNREILGVSIFDKKYRERLRDQYVNTIIYGINDPWK